MGNQISKVKIAIVVHGRFHAFDLANALLARGHDVTLFTNYPQWAVARFGFPKERTRSFWLHAVLTRAARKLTRGRSHLYPEPFFQRLFGRWAARHLSWEEWDIVHIWSGVAEESLAALRGRPGMLTWLARGSAHIRTQAQLMQEEAARTGAAQERPSDWIIAREEREYQQADSIRVLSTFAVRSFVDQGVPLERLILNPLGVDTAKFRPPPEVNAARQERIKAGSPLQLLFVGSASFRKGLWDLAAVARALQDEPFSFRCVGPQPQETERLRQELAGLVEFVPTQPQRELPKWYAPADLFLFPTIEDGFAVVLAQAQASGLPVLATENCAAPDMVREGETGWTLPIRSPEALVERLRWCHHNRAALAEMAAKTYAAYQPRAWADTAIEFEKYALMQLEDSRKVRI